MSKTKPIARHRSTQYVFLPTAKQIKAIGMLMAERRKLDEHVSQGSLLRELVQRGLDSL